MAQALSTPLPQDVIDQIIDHLRNDPTTSKTCSLASRAIYELTRKHLFATITLDRPRTVLSLTQTLERNPNISTHIRSLKIPELDEDILRRLVPILPTLKRTRHLVLGTNAYIYAEPVLSAQVLALLSTVLQQLPYLTALEIRSVCEFPASHLTIAQGLETLSIKNSSIARGSAGGTLAFTRGRPLRQIRSLYLARVWCWEAVATPIVHVPNLREIAILTPKNVVQPVIQAGAESIETVFWVGYVHGRGYSMVDLGVLRNLRRLCFVMSGGDGENSYAHGTWGYEVRNLEG